MNAQLEGLKQRAKTVVQLKPRNPATAIKNKLPIQAVCDFKQMEVGILDFQHGMNLKCFQVN